MAELSDPLIGVGVTAMGSRHGPEGPRSARGRGRRVLLAWELGDGLGHAARLLPVAQRLRADGWVPVVAARTPGTLAARYAAARVPVIAAPAPRACATGPAFRAASFADIMGAYGYAETTHLAAALAGWDRILDEQAPALVIADYAPLLSLAALGRCPVIGFGDGFVTPPGTATGGFPPLCGAAAPVWDPAHLLDNARRVQAGRGRPQPDSLAAIIGGAGQVVAVPPELDIYRNARAQPADGPWDVAAPILAPPTAPRVFAYLRMRHAHTRTVLTALQGLELAVACHVQGATAGELADLRRAGLEVHEQPPALRPALAQATMFVHHGGIGSLMDAATAGRPQLLVPRHLEQLLNAECAIANLPGVFAVRAGAPLAPLRRRLAVHLDNARLLPAAQATAARLAARPGTAWQALSRLIATVV